jgi:hypothetical protein
VAAATCCKAAGVAGARLAHPYRVGLCFLARSLLLPLFFSWSSAACPRSLANHSLESARHSPRSHPRLKKCASYLRFRKFLNETSPSILPRYNQRHPTPAHRSFPSSCSSPCQTVSLPPSSPLILPKAFRPVLFRLLVRLQQSSRHHPTLLRPSRTLQNILMPRDDSPPPPPPAPPNSPVLK